MKRPTARLRPGMSLLEAILALAILGTSLAILSQVMGTGVDAGREANDLALCRMVALRQMAELQLNSDSGIAPATQMDVPVEDFQTGSGRPMMADIEVQPGMLIGLLNVRVTARSMGGDSQYPIAEFSLVRWIVDPVMKQVQTEI